MNLTQFVLVVLLCIACSPAQAGSIFRQNVAIRDPFIYVDSAAGRYYMYGTADTSDGKLGFDVRETSDQTLQTWDPPKPVWRKPDDFWGVRAYWAPEVHKYKGKYYLFATFEAPGRPRAVQILSADSPEGPFKVHSPEPVTPPEYFALDGTLYVDKKGDPWMVYSREHISVYDGQMRAVRLRDDLTGTLASTDILLFTASSFPLSAHWERDGQRCYVTDGPQMLRLSNRELVMLWSTNTYLPQPIFWGYGVVVSRSTSGEVQGPWVHDTQPLYNGFAGHGQVFQSPNRGLILSMHQPNNGGRPYPMFLQVYENKGRLTLSEPAPKHVQAYWRFEDLTPGHTVLPSIDILDYSGNGNHLRGDDFGSVGTASSDVPQPKIRLTGRPNLFCYDNRMFPKDAPARFLNTVEKPLNQQVYKDWTVEISVNPSQLSGPQFFLCREPDLSIGTKGGRILVAYKGSQILSRSLVPLRKWSNVAVISDGTRMRLYINAELDSSLEISSGDTGLTEGRWIVGCGISDGKLADQFIGLIDEVRISNKALTLSKMLFSGKVVH